MPEKSPLAELCVLQNEVRSNHYSTTYRAPLQVGDEDGVWDITHISLPFSPLKERELMAWTGLTEDKLTDFYSRFAKAVQNALSNWRHLAGHNVPGVAHLAAYDINKKDGQRGSDIYLVTKPMEAAVQTCRLYTGGTASVLDILDLTEHLLSLTQHLYEANCHLGVVDMDDVYTAQQENGGREYLLGGLLFSSLAQEKDGKKDTRWAKPTELHPPHINQEVLAGEKPSLATDVYSIFSLTWTLLNGNHYATPPNFLVPPRFAMSELTDILRRGVDEDNVYLSEEEFLPLLQSICQDLHMFIEKVESEAGYQNTGITFDAPACDLSESHGAHRLPPPKPRQPKPLFEMPTPKEEAPTPEVKPHENPPREEAPTAESEKPAEVKTPASAKAEELPKSESAAKEGKVESGGQTAKKSTSSKKTTTKRGKKNPKKR